MGAFAFMRCAALPVFTDMSLLSCHWYAVKAPVTAACICIHACLLVR